MFGRDLSVKARCEQTQKAWLPSLSGTMAPLAVGGVKSTQALDYSFDHMAKTLEHVYVVMAPPTP